LHKPISLLTGLILSLCFSIPLLHAEPSTAQALLHKIDAFKQTANYPFAMQTIQRADAYLGASMLATEQGDAKEAANALAQATDKLDEAKQTATSFRSQFAALIRLRRDALQSVHIIVTQDQSASGQLKSSRSASNRVQSNRPEANQTEAHSSAEDMANAGNHAFAQTIANYETGQLNQAQAQATKAQHHFQQLLAETLPRLTELSARAMGKAAHSGAKRYAPQTYQAAKDHLAILEAYTDGLTKRIPSPPEQALLLAQAARNMAIQVKHWRKKTRSHEAIVLKQRLMKLQLANALHISTANNAMLVDIPANTILQTVKKLKATLIDERKHHQQAMTKLKQQASQELQRQLAAQAQTMLAAQQHRMSIVKEAFRAKLERETFDKKRQQQLHALFKGYDVNTMVNLDGSLLLRLSGLKFAPGKSKIDTAFVSMLSQLNAAMDIYTDRQFSIEGHTDNLGKVKSNRVLSLKRAEAVRDFLIAAGADGRRLKALGYGEVRPIASNDFPQGRAMNRRIDIIIKPITHPTQSSK